MKNTSIVIPIILIICLSALGFLFYKALQTVEEDRPSGNNSIVLNQADYADEPTPEDVGATTDYEAIAPPPAPTKETNDDPPTNALTEMTEEEKRAAQREELAEAARLAREEEARRTADANDESAETPVATEPAGTGRYLVIAGSFRQRSGAEVRVAKLRKAGFKDTSLERFNRGTFAVALAGQSDRYSEATKLASKIREAGFEAEVMRRR